MVLFDSIRPAKLAELPLLQAIERAADKQFIVAGYPEFADGEVLPDEVAARSLAEDGLHVIEWHGEVKGWVCIDRIGTDCYVNQICVHPNSQQLGLGTLLMQFVVEDAITKGMQTVVLNTQSDVVWNQPWYERLGFEVVDRSDWTTTMHADTANQIARGLDWSSRVHMRLILER